MHEHDLRVGKGRQTWRSGAVLEGEWNGKFKGGTYTRPMGVENAIQCCGKLQLIDGEYEGEYLKIEETENVFPHGKGGM